MRLTVERLGQHGDGVAEGGVFVARALPGEVVEGEVEDGRIAAPKIAVPSPDRVAPPCPHYRRCGGCGLQHMRDDRIAAFKTDKVKAALQAHDLSPDVELIHTSPPMSRRRASLSGHRTKKGAIVGFHGPQMQMIAPIPQCLVLTPAIIAALPAFEELTRRFGSRRSEMRFAVTDTPAGLDVDVSGPEMPQGAATQELFALSRDAGFSRVSWDGETVVTHAEPFVLFRGIRVPLPTRSFLQATAEAENAMQEAVLAGLEGADGAVIDLFSGLGTFSLPVARMRPVHAVEGDPDAVAALGKGWRHGAGLKQVTTLRRDLFRQPFDGSDLADFAAAIIDPPRAGAAAQMAELAKSGLSRVVSVSCNPATFARDAATLTAGGFRMGPVAVIDQFRWSPHVETISVFMK